MSVLDEECTGNGSLACLERGYRADACVIPGVSMAFKNTNNPEPFPSIMTAQMGVMWLELTVSGRPAHVLDTSAGFNAIEAMFALYTSLKVLEESWNAPEVRPEVYKKFAV
jgi:acetylornithine deacetylase